MIRLYSRVTTDAVRATGSRRPAGDFRTAALNPTLKLARRVSRAARRAGAWRTLLLDLDGTLAPIAQTPGQAAVPEATLEALRRVVAHGWTVAVVSGRPAALARRMVPVAGVRIFGSHGLEGTWRVAKRRAAPPRSHRRIERLAAAARRLAATTPGVLIERKPAGVAFHDRRVPRRLRASWRRRLETWLANRDLSGLDRLDGKCVVELRPAGVHKGRIVEALPRRPGAPRPDASLVGIGDDRTDEDLFRALRGRGLAVRVGPPGARSVARSRLPSPAAVQRFLSGLTSAVNPARTAPRRSRARRRSR
jgi:trehalose-phosphatase